MLTQVSGAVAYQVGNETKLWLCHRESDKEIVELFAAECPDRGIVEEVNVLFVVTSPLTEDSRKDAMKVITTIVVESLEAQHKADGKMMTPAFYRFFMENLIAGLQLLSLEGLEAKFQLSLSEVNHAQKETNSADSISVDINSGSPGQEGGKESPGQGRNQAAQDQKS